MCTQTMYRIFLCKTCFHCYAQILLVLLHFVTKQYLKTSGMIYVKYLEYVYIYIYIYIYIYSIYIYIYIYTVYIYIYIQYIYIYTVYIYIYIYCIYMKGTILLANNTFNFSLLITKLAYSFRQLGM